VSARLEVLNAAGQVVERIAIERRVVTVGRSEANAVVTRDPLASKTHAEIALVGGRFVVKDLGSRNGTFLNGAKVQGAVPLEDCDVVRVGATHIRFRADAAARSAPRAAETLEFVGPEVERAAGPAGALELLKDATARIAAAEEPVTLFEELLADFFGLAAAEAAELVLLETDDSDRGPTPLLRVAVDSRIEDPDALTAKKRFGVAKVADPNAPPLPEARAVVERLIAERRAVDGAEVVAEQPWNPDAVVESPARLAVPIAGGGRLFGYAYVERRAARGAFSPAEAAAIGVLADALGAYLRGVFADS
jgi:predicted component of type VI protein secretion system